MSGIWYYEIYNGWNWGMIRKCYPAVSGCVICAKFIKETKFFPLNCLTKVLLPKVFSVNFSEYNLKTYGANQQVILYTLI